MKVTPILLTASTLAVAQAATYQVHGIVQQHTNTVLQTTLYYPSIYLSIDGTQVCDGHGIGEEINVYNEAFTPGGVPTNSSFSGPWGAADCSEPLVQVDLFGVNGQALVRDNTTACYINPPALGWAQVATSQGLAGIPSTVVSVWQFDSGNVEC